METTKVMPVWHMKTHLLLTLLAVFTTVLIMQLFLSFLFSTVFLNKLPGKCCGELLFYFVFLCWFSRL
jgi:hypothetical protein